MMLQRTRRLAGLAAIALTVAGCSVISNVKHGADTVGVCIDVAGSVTTAAQVAVQLAAGSLTQAEAASKLAPVVTHVDDLAKQNASLPIGTTLTRLSKAISAVQQGSPSSPAALQASASELGAASKAVLDSCKAVGQ